MGSAFALMAAVLGHLYSKIDSLHKDTDTKIDSLRVNTEESSDAQVVRIEAQLQKLHEELAEDRRESVKFHQEIARSMVTQDKLDRQIDRIVRALTRGNRGIEE